MTWKRGRKRSKYGNVKTAVDGFIFHSKKEADRYVVLRQEHRLGTISDLELQPKYRIDVCGQRICTYIGDFRYRRDGVLILEDVKGRKTDVYKLKRKLVKAVWGITILET